MLEGRSQKRKYNANSLPVAKQMPKYKAWAYLPANECAVQTGRQMYYMDATTGEARCHVSVHRAAGLWVHAAGLWTGAAATPAPFKCMVHT